MYNVNDIVMHKGAGVCRIKDIKEEKMIGSEKKLYYVLSPVYDNDSKTLYIPVDNDNIKLRALLSRNEIIDLIRGVSLDKPLWIDNNIVRKNTFAQILSDGNNSVMMQLIVELKLKRDELTNAGKKFHVTDEKVLREAEKRIYQEFAYVLSVPLDQIPEMITSYLDPNLL